jgi:hypothetical protein
MKEELNFTNIGNKESQKELIKEIMDLDAKDGLYDTVNDTVNELDKLAEETFKGDDATTFVQREIWKDGYNKAKETLYTEAAKKAERILNANMMKKETDDVDKLAHQYNPVMKLDAEFIRAGFKAGYNKAKETLYTEISDEEIERGIKREYLFSNSEEKRLMIEGAIWYRKQLKRNI